MIKILYNNDKMNNSRIRWVDQSGTSDASGFFRITLPDTIYRPVAGFVLSPTTSTQRSFRVTRNPGNGVFYGQIDANLSFTCEILFVAE